ncbi:MAG: type II toxin-antitoxin system HicB family antitoxin [Armatimonadota bacterium]
MVEYEHEGDSWSAYVPDLPGCIATGKSKEEVSRLIHEAMEFHIEGLCEEGFPVPAPSPIYVGVVPFRVQVVNPAPANRVIRFERVMRAHEGRTPCA